MTLLEMQQLQKVPYGVKAHRADSLWLSCEMSIAVVRHKPHINADCQKDNFHITFMCNLFHNI